MCTPTFKQTMGGVQAGKATAKAGLIGGLVDKAKKRTPGAAVAVSGMLGSTVAKAAPAISTHL